MIRVRLLHGDHGCGQRIQICHSAPIDIGGIGIGFLAEIDIGSRPCCDGGNTIELAAYSAAVQDRFIAVAEKSLGLLAVLLQQIIQGSYLAVCDQIAQRLIPERREKIQGIIAACQQQVQLLLHGAEGDPNRFDLRMSFFPKDSVDRVHDFLFLGAGITVHAVHIEAQHGVLLVLYRCFAAFGSAAFGRALHFAGACAGLIAAAARAGQDQSQHQQHCKYLFHSFISSCCFVIFQ